jgi:Carboxypeptidase regulatory-like domain
VASNHDAWDWCLRRAVTKPNAPTPTAPTPSPPPPAPTRFTVRGVVRETAPSPTPALPGASVELVGGPDAANVSADQNGAFTLQNVSAQTGMIRASLSGYETETKTVVVAADVVLDFALGHTWPTPLLSMLNRLPVIDGLKFKRAPGSGPSYYSSSPPVAVYVSPAPFSGEIGSIAHEVCHALQDRFARASGQGDFWLLRHRRGQEFSRIDGMVSVRA